jgi:signal transduction histidine kinase
MRPARRRCVDANGTADGWNRHDLGRGIAREAQPQIFERFYRADAAHARDAGSASGGAGLGLAIARWVAEAHAGMLVLVSSVPGETVFEATLRRLSRTG